MKLEKSTGETEREVLSMGRPVGHVRQGSCSEWVEECKVGVGGEDKSPGGKKKHFV